MKIITSSIFKELVDLECKLHDSESRKKPELLESLLGQGFFEFGSSGNRFSRKEIIESLSAEDTKKILASDFESFQITENVVLLTYKTNIISLSEKNSHAIRSTLWRKENDHWVMIFHQGTPVSS
jgi:hypothetical protein